MIYDKSRKSPFSRWHRYGQPIPAGLHVRMNLKTGVTEAKLMDKDESSSKETALLAVTPDAAQDEEDEHVIDDVEDDDENDNDDENENDDDDDDNDDEGPVKIVQTAQHVDGVHVMAAADGEHTVFANGKLTNKQIYDALQTFNDGELEDATAEDIARIKEKFRSLKELREELASLNLGMRSEAEEVARLIKKYEEADGDEADQLIAIRELEYVVHHVDAAKDLVQGNGIKIIVIPSLNSTSALLRTGGAQLMGAAAQGNPTVQLAALQDGVIRLLLQQFTPGVADLKSDTQIIYRVSVFAISCLVRGFPAGQRNFVEQGGLSVLAKVFDESNVDIKIKVATLFHDLVLEAEQATQAELQYETLDLHGLLVQYGWCEKIGSLLNLPVLDKIKYQKGYRSLTKRQEIALNAAHDMLEKIIAALHVLSKCKSQFKQFLPVLGELYSAYRLLLGADGIYGIFGDDDDYGQYHLEMFHLIKQLFDYISEKDEL